MTVHTVSATLLQQQIKGQVVIPDDADYEQLRRGWNLTINQYPALIIVAADVEDVIAGIRYARETGLSVAVQSTGHGLQLPAHDSLLIITSRLKGVEIDPKARIARMQAGIVWGEVVEKTVPYGLAPLLGSSPHVGVVGYTLGGGIGWLARKYGLAADSVRSIDIVTPDGVLRHTSPTENSDLFWGLRGGGGGNFGVVTAIEVNLFPVATLYGGHLMYGGDLAGSALRFYRDWIQAVPNELTSSIAVMKFPNFPQVPDEMRGKVFVMMRAAYTGEATEGQQYIQQWLDWNPPIVNTFHTLPFAEIATISNDPVDPVASSYSNELLDSLSDDAIEIIVRTMTNPASPLMVTELRHAGGAITRVPVNPSAIGNRDALLYMQMAGLAPTPEVQTAVEAAIQQYKQAMKPYLRGNVYLNFVKGHEASTRAKDAYSPEVYQRLVALKNQHDPELMFRFGYQLVTQSDR